MILTAPRFSHTDFRVPDSTRQAVTWLRQNGIYCVVATGWHTCELAYLPIDLELDAWITLNGQLCFEGDAYFRRQPLEHVDVLQEQFARHHLALMLAEEKRMYISFIDDAVRRAYHAVFPQASNVWGMVAFCQRHGIGRMQTMAFGDGENDMEMLRWAGIGVAMGHAVCG